MATDGEKVKEAVAEEVAKPASPKKAKKSLGKTKKAKVPGQHPSYLIMVKEAIESLNESKGSSRAALLKYILKNYKLSDTNPAQVNARIRQTLKRGVKSGSLKQVKGIGASGSFRLPGAAKDTAKPEKKAKRSSRVKKTAEKVKTTVKSKKRVSKAKAEAKPKKIKKAAPKAAKPATAKKEVKKPIAKVKVAAKTTKMKRKAKKA